MAPFKVKVNTYFQENQWLFVDHQSKYCILGESLFGLNRLPVILRGTRFYNIVVSVICAYNVALLIMIIYKTYCVNDYVWNVSCVEYCFCCLFSFVSWKRMERYYREVNKFDADIGCRPKMTSDSFRNVIGMVTFTVLVSTLYASCYGSSWSIPTYFEAVPMIVIHCVEVFNYGHLLSLLTPRLRLINYYVESALSGEKLVKRPDVEEFVSFKNKNNKNGEMRKLMDLYHTVIKSYDFLIEAIKWQLLVILITSFITTLMCCYRISISIIRESDSLFDQLANIGMMTLQMTPLFSPCMFGDRVHNEVKRLRELLASRLYDNKLDKCGRSAARALLALTEARDLSLSLLRMLRIDIALPFKFVGLLVTYLIILLQFEKVITPSAPVATTQSI